MKKNLLYLFALICSMTLFTACSDDDDNQTTPEPPVLATSEIAGSYSGSLDVSIAGESSGPITDVPVTVTAAEDGSTVTISLNYNLNGSLPLDISVDCSTVATENQITMSGSTNVALFGGELPTTVTGTADGTNLNLNIAVDASALLGYNVDVVYTGTK